MNIYQTAPADYPELIELWEASVRATHHFLKEEDIGLYRQRILEEYFDAVKLYCTKDNGVIAGFLGIGDGMIQMLFIHPEARGKGVGKRLLEYAMNEHGVKKVEVNEQNEQALGFYQYMGFTVTARAETDGLGKPYPILLMELQ